MKVQVHPYQLAPFSALNAVSTGQVREGCLVKVIFENGDIGYSDLFAWPELGDLSVRDQLALFRRGQKTPQVEQSLKLAERDAQFRAKKTNLFEGREPLRNNALLTAHSQIGENFLLRLKEQGFSTLKVKVGNDFVSAIDSISLAAKMGFKLRLDFNGTLTAESFQKFCLLLKDDCISKIEYVEDPFPLVGDNWLNARSPVPLALDFFIDEVDWNKIEKCSFGVLIIKPAKINPDQAVELCKKLNLKFAVTSYLDHPVGVLHAYSWALELQERVPDLSLEPGCLTFSQYREDDFSREVVRSGPFIKGNRGSGIGFDKLLENLLWQD